MRRNLSRLYIFTISAMLGISILTACDTPTIIPTGDPLPAVSKTFTFRPSHTWTTTSAASSTPIPTTTPTLTPTASVTLTATPTPSPTAFGGFKDHRLVAWIANRQIVVSQIDGSKPVILKTGVLNNIYPGLVGWTLDGEWILFSEACIGGCNNHLWAARPDGSEVKLVSSSLSDYRNFSWHPEGTRFIFECGPISQSQTGDFPAAEHKICQASSIDFSITPTSLAGMDPQYSPDGKQVALARISYTSNKVSLFVANDLQNQPTLISTYDGWMAEYTWMADSQQIVYVQRNNLTCEIFKIRVGDLASERLLRLENCFPSLMFVDHSSPTGKYVVFYHQSRAYILDIDEPEKPALARAPLGARLVWSPDGKLYALAPGSLAVLIDPQTGESAEIKTENPWLAISRWAPANVPFYFFEISLQP